MSKKSTLPEICWASWIWELSFFYISGILQFSVTAPGLPQWLSSKESACTVQEPQETWVPFLCQEDPLEEGMAAHSSILSWGTLWTEEPGGLQSIGLQTAWHKRTDLACIPWSVYYHFSILCSPLELCSEIWNIYCIIFPVSKLSDILCLSLSFWPDSWTIFLGLRSLLILS